MQVFGLVRECSSHIQTQRWERERTLTAGQSSVPLGSVGAAHDTGETGITLELVAWITVEGHSGAQLIVSTQPSAIHHAARVKTSLTQFSYTGEEHKTYGI